MMDKPKTAPPAGAISALSPVCSERVFVERATAAFRNRERRFGGLIVKTGT